MNSKQEQMKNRPIFPLLVSMAIPMMFSMLIQSLYNIIDSIFVARLGNDALTAVSLVFPLQNLVIAIAVGFGIGVSSCISINLGSKNTKRASQAASVGIVLSIVHSILFVMNLSLKWDLSTDILYFAYPLVALSKFVLRRFSNHLARCPLL